MKIKMLDRITPLAFSEGQEVWHTCWRYKDTIKTVYCESCKTKEYNEYKKLVKFGPTKISTQ